MKNTIFASIALGLIAGSAQAQTVGAQTQVDTGRGAFAPCNETTIAASEANPLHIVAAWNDYRTQIRCGVGLSLDGGVTWTDFLLRPPLAFQGGVEGDPMTCQDPRTGALWVGAISFDNNGGMYVARKDGGSSTFNPTVMAAISGTADKGWMAAGPDPADANLTRVYMSYNEGTIFSADMGDTWSAPNLVDSGLGFLPKVGPNGELYIAYWDFNLEMRLMRSFDGGVTYGAPITVVNRMDTWGIDSSRVPGNARAVVLPGLAVDPNDGTLYYVYPDTTSIESNGFNLDTYLTKSVDQGATWSTPVVINSDAALPGDQYNAWIEVDASSRVHMVTFDTRGTAQNDTDSQGFIDSYYSFSDDGGASWTEIDLTATPMDTVAAFPSGNFVGDYLGLSTAGNRTLPCYVDTEAGDSDIFVSLVTHDTGTVYCTGIGCPCGNNGDAGQGEGCHHSFGDGGKLRATGDPAFNNVVFQGTNMPAVTTAVLIRSTVQENNGLGSVFGDGLICVGTPTVRVQAQITAGGAANFAINHGAGPGTFHYQLWFRNTLAFCNPEAFNLSNALSLIFP